MNFYEERIGTSIKSNCEFSPASIINFSVSETSNAYRVFIISPFFFTFPKVINWFGADIAFHHIHHLSGSIPNYNLAPAHREFAHLFADVKRIKLRDVLKEFKFILWDEKNQKIISIAQYNEMKLAL